MRTLWNISHTLFTTLGGIVGWFLGGTDGFLLALITLVVIDYTTGVIAAYTTGQLSSSVGFKGIARKVMIFALVGLAHILDVHILGEGGVLRTATIFFYLANEGLSITENAALIGLPIPNKLQQALAAISTSHPPKPGGSSPDSPHGGNKPEFQPPSNSAGGFLLPKNEAKEQS